MPRRILFAFLMGLCLFGFFGWPKTSPAAEQDAPPDVGQPKALAVEPANVSLSLGAVPGVQQLVVTGKYADGSVRDLTRLARGRIEGGHAALAPGLFLEAVQPGRGSVEIEAGGLKVSVPVSVSGGKPEPVSFRNELMAVLNVGGCNQGACHGTPSGKNGFKLSLRGFDPAADYLNLTHDVLGRRSGRQDPQGSLVYLKALGRVPHDGGIRFAADSLPGRTLHAWLMGGARNDLDTARTLKKLEVLPGGRVLREPGRRQQVAQQLAVLAHLSDGQVRDVTRLTVFSSSDTAIATVDAHGLVEFHRAGEAAILCRYLQEMVSVRLMFLQPRPGFKWPGPPENNYIDRHVFAKLKLLDIAPSELCSDQEFIRRAYLDVCGVLPRPGEVRDFLASKKGKGEGEGEGEGDRRAALIDRLLERPEYADLWALKWSDVLRSLRKTLQLRGVKAYHQWIRDRIAANTPLDQVVRDLITAEGSTFSNPPANYYRAAREPTALAETTAQLFFGIRMQCAKCHNHPFERWSQDDYYGMTAFFAQVKRKTDPKEPGDPKKKDGAELIFIDARMNITHPRTGKPAEPRFLGDPQAWAKVAADKDRRLALAEWMTAPANPFLARSVVNRIWFHLLGRGIVDPVDDFRDSNPSANDELLNALARDFVEKKFDVKHILRTILNSRTYQLSAQANEFNRDDVKYFSHALTRVYSAEVLFDAVCELTEVPEKFTDMPPGTRAAQLFDSEFNHPFLKAFGQPGRALACECERESESNLTQVLQLISGPAVNERVRNPKNRIGKLLTAKKSDREILEELFLVALSRPPAAFEAQGLLDHVAGSQDRRKGWEDVLWVLLNAKEFSFRH